MRTPFPKVGDRIRLADGGSYRLPKGLEEGQEVVIVEERHGPYFNVMDDAGQKYGPVAVQCMELEQIYFWEGRWRREKHPAVLAYLKEVADQLEASRDRWPSGIGWANQAILTYNRRALERWAALGYLPGGSSLAR